MPPTPALSKHAPGVEERPSGPSVVQNGEGESCVAVCVPIGVCT